MMRHKSLFVIMLSLGTGFVLVVVAAGHFYYTSQLRWPHGFDREFWLQSPGQRAVMGEEAILSQVRVGMSVRELYRRLGPATALNEDEVLFVQRASEYYRVTYPLGGDPKTWAHEMMYLDIEIDDKGTVRSARVYEE